MGKLKTPLPVVLYIAFLTSLMLISVGYSIATRTFEDYVEYVHAITLFWFVFFIYLAINQAHANGRVLGRPRFKGIMLFIAIAIPMAVVTYGIGVSAKDLYLWVAATRYEFIIVGTALVLGFYLFQLRLNLRLLYGISEVMVGLFVAAYRHTQSTSIWHFDVFLPFLTAGVYLVVRGFDNIHQGLMQDPPDPLVLWVKSLSKTSNTQSEAVPRRIKKKESRLKPIETMKTRRLVNKTSPSRMAPTKH